MRKDIANMRQDPMNKPNLTRNERLAVKELISSNDIIINKADKGSTIVVRNKTDYIREGLEHLSDSNTYLKLDCVTDQVTVTIRNTLEKLGPLYQQLSYISSKNPQKSHRHQANSIHKQWAIFKTM